MTLVDIIGGASQVDLDVADWSGALAHPGLVSWISFDPHALALEAGRIASVRGRAGAGQERSADSAGPVAVDRGGLTAAKFGNGVLEYLHAPVTVDAASHSAALVVHIDRYVPSGRVAMGMFAAGNGLYLRRYSGRYEVRLGNTSYAQSSAGQTATGWVLLVWSQHQGRSRLLVQPLGSPPEHAEAAGPDMDGLPAVTPVLGADEIANGNIGAAPNASTSWDDCIADCWVWDGIDVLAPANAAYLDRLTDYFVTVYGVAL